MLAVTRPGAIEWGAVTATIEPEPPEEEREAILAVLAVPAPGDGEWAAAALSEGVEEGEPDP